MQKKLLTAPDGNSFFINGRQFPLNDVIVDYYEAPLNKVVITPKKENVILYSGKFSEYTNGSTNAPFASMADIKAYISSGFFRKPGVVAGGGGGGIGSVTSANDDIFVSNSTTNPVLRLDKFNGQLPAYYLNFTNATNKPTTAAGYGITDVYSKTVSDGRYVASSTANQAAGFVQLDGGAKIPLALFPDSLLGNVKYKGTYDGTTISSPDAALNGNALPAAASGNQGYYFIASAPFTNNSVNYVIGDWIISDGAAGYTRIENSDAVSTVFGRNGNVVAAVGDYSAYYPVLSGAYVNPSWITSLPYSKITGTPTTLAGYGITDAATPGNPTASIGTAAINGSATSFMRSDAAPALNMAIAPSWTGSHTFVKTALALATVDVVNLVNTTAAALNNQQVTPALHFTSNGWATGASASQTSDWRIYGLPAQGGGTVVSGSINFDFAANGTAYTNRLQLSNTGLILTGFYRSNAFNITTTPTDAYVAANSTAATAGSPVQMSPRMRFSGNVWNTTATAANNTADASIEMTVASGLTPSNSLRMGFSMAGGAYSYPFTFDNAGNITTSAINNYSTGGLLSIVRNATTGRFEAINSNAYITNVAGTDANYTISLASGDNIILPAITAARTVTFPAIVDGKIIYIWNQNTSANAWSINASPAVKSSALATQSTVNNQSYTSYIGSSAASTWIRLI